MRPTRLLPAILLGSAVSLFFGRTAHADLVAVGHEFRPTLAERQVPDDCIDPDGVTAHVYIGCPDGARDEMGHCDLDWIYFVDWRDRSGTVVAGPYQINDGSGDGFSFACSGDTVMALYDGVVRTIRRSGSASAPTPVVPDASGYHVFMETVVRAGDGFLVVGNLAADGRTISGRWFSIDGQPRGDVFDVVAPDAEEILESIFARADGGGSVLVAWESEGVDDYGVRIRATLVRGAEAGAPVRLSEFPHLDLSSLLIRAEDAGRFLVAWTSQLQAGWVARRVADSDTTPSTTTTTTTLPTDEPDFLPAQTLEESTTSIWQAPQFPVSLAGDRRGTWAALWRKSPTRADDSLSTRSFSGDDGRRWSQPADIDESDNSSETRIAADGRGTWIAASLIADRSDIRLRRSTDSGRSWTPVASLFAMLADAGDLDPRNSSITLAAGSDGVWTAAWITEAWRPAPFTRDNPDGGQWICMVEASTSSNGGVAWSPPATVGWCGGSRGGLQVATDRHGDWLIAWADTRISGAISTNNARSWSPAGVLLRSTNARKRDLSLAADDSGNWMLAFSALERDPAGDDVWRVFVSRSSGLGSGWSAPAALAPWHDAEGGLDDSPCVTAAGNSRWGIAWRTYTDVDGNGLDSDIVVSFSNDSGTSWTRPRLVDPAARGDSRTDEIPQLAHGGADVWGVLWRSSEDGSSRYGYGRDESIRVALTQDECGNGRRDVAEECDDGNSVDGDGCDSNCLATACGNRIVTPGEQCDDGNDVETDGCISTCRFASCGDGFTQAGVEECDDGNGIDTDGCTSACTTAVCGDGHVWTGHEACDDGNASNNDGCLRSCESARCGDGYLELASEECDDGNSSSGDGCSDRCKLECGGAARRPVTATSAMRVLRKAVGIAGRCPLRQCDVDRNGRITTVDALKTLSIAVGLSVDCGSWRSVSVRLESTGPVSALEFTLHYADSTGAIAGTGPEANCTVLPQGTGDVLTAINNIAENGEVRAGFITLSEVHGPIELLRCNLEQPIPRSARAFAVTVDDASDSVGNDLTSSTRVVAVPE